MAMTEGEEVAEMSTRETVCSFIKKGMAKEQTEVCRKKHYSNGEDYAIL